MRLWFCKFVPRQKIPSTKTTVSTFVCLFHRFSLPNHLEYTRSLLASIPCRAIRIHTRFGRELSSASLCRLSRLVPDESHEGEKSPWISTLDGKWSHPSFSLLVDSFPLWCWLALCWLFRRREQEKMGRHAVLQNIYLSLFLVVGSPRAKFLSKNVATF